MRRQGDLLPAGSLTEDEKQKTKVALQAVTTLAQAVLASSRHTRFSETARICEIGQELVKATSRRVDDLCKGDGTYEIAGDQQMMMVGNAVQYVANRPLDEQQLLRDALLSLSRASTEQQKLANIASSESEELRNLVGLLHSAASEERQTIETRVRRLMQNMEERNAVVPTDFPRRHSLGVKGGADDSSGNGADTDRDTGGGGAPEEGPEPRMGQEAVG